MARRRTARGFTLLEVMVAMAILLVALVGLMRMQVIGLASNGGARMHMQASELAQELAQGLERLQPSDARLAPTYVSSDSAPADFGHLISPLGVLATTPGIQVWDDANPVPGVRSSTELPTGYERRWTVWGYAATGSTTAGSLMIAVSVVWREPALPRPREVVAYTQVPQPATLMSGIVNNQ